jgi:hypothetical protein
MFKRILVASAARGSRFRRVSARSRASSTGMAAIDALARQADAGSGVEPGGQPLVGKRQHGLRAATDRAPATDSVDRSDRHERLDSGQDTLEVEGELGGGATCADRRVTTEQADDVRDVLAKGRHSAAYDAHGGAGVYGEDGRSRAARITASSRSMVNGFST